VRNTARLPLVAFVLAAVAALTLAACGGGADPNKVLNQTFSGNKQVRSGRVDLSLTLKAEGVPQLQKPVTIKLSGPFQGQGGSLPQFDFALALSASGQSFSAGAVSTGDKGFLKFQGQSYAVPVNVFASFKQGYEQARSQQRQRGAQNPSLASFGVNPRDWLKDPKSEGDADVEGTSTNHISAKVDVGKLLDDVNRILQRTRGRLPQAQTLPSGITAQQRKTIENAIKESSFEVYSGKDDHVLRRMVVKLTFSVPETARRQASGLKGGNIGFDLTLAGLNQPQTISAPAAARPFSDLTSRLRSSLGGLAGGAVTPSGGAAAPSGGTGNAKAQQYLQCLQRAGGDVSKAQRCAALLNG
jgi:hypothetical protein